MIKDNQGLDLHEESSQNTRQVAEFPGAHCGLFEASVMAPLFPSSIALVIAPPSCSYHAKLIANRRLQAPNSKEDNLYCLNLSQEDMIFGVEPVIEEALEEIDELLNPEMIFLISTCTPEIIGFDGSSLAMIKNRLKAKVVVVKTNGYECLHQQKGSIDYLTSLVEVMQPMEVNPLSVNILGLRSTNWKETEIIQVLERAGISINVALPGANHLYEIERAPAAALNIVIGKIAKPLATKMEEQFGTPYITYDFLYKTEQIVQGYQRIVDFLNVKLPHEIEQFKEQHLQFIDKKRYQLAGISFGIGAVEGSNIEAASFYASIGMIPKFLTTRIPLKENNPDLLDMKQQDIDLPIIYLNKAVKMQSIIKQYQPQIFLGHAQSEVLRKENVLHIHPAIQRCGPGFMAVQQDLENIVDLIHCGRGGEEL